MEERIPLKDKNYRIIGYIVVSDNGDKKIQDKNYRTLGYYKKAQDKTIDKNYRTVGYGDLLTTLLTIE